MVTNSQLHYLLSCCIVSKPQTTDGTQHNSYSDQISVRLPLALLTYRRSHSTDGTPHISYCVQQSVYLTWTCLTKRKAQIEDGKPHNIY